MEGTILTPEQVAQILQVHPFTVLKFIKQGKLKASRLGRVYRIRRSDVDKFLDEQTSQVVDRAAAKKGRPVVTESIKDRVGTKVSSKDTSQDSPLTSESKGGALKEKTKHTTPKKEPVAGQDDKLLIDEPKKAPEQPQTPKRNQEDHYVIELKL